MKYISIEGKNKFKNNKYTDVNTIIIPGVWMSKYAD